MKRFSLALLGGAAVTVLAAAALFFMGVALSPYLLVCAAFLGAGGYLLLKTGPLAAGSVPWPAPTAAETRDFGTDTSQITQTEDAVRAVLTGHDSRTLQRRLAACASARGQRLHGKDPLLTDGVLTPELTLLLRDTEQQMDGRMLSAYLGEIESL
ncbi:hypothetical protein KRX56_01450 [Dermabacteraceae bacterium TAE3-ERU27]|nr:hypothetical protein [Dermabacteraceae bacterium TAE3-ERU27]